MPQPQDSTDQLDSKALRSLLKEFLDPVRTDDSRADFYNAYRRESESFDRDYVGKYSQDLDTSLLFAGLFSSVSATFVTNIQSDLKPDPTEVTAAYMQLLIHTMNNSLFPNTDPTSVALASANRPSNIVAVQAVLYTSLVISLLAAFLAMLGKQWINRYTRNNGGSTAEKSQDRQRKFDALRDWRFHLVIESLSVMLQLALLLLGCALSMYLWTINRPIAQIIIAFTLSGVALYTLITIAAMLSPSCPYQTPLYVLTQALIRGTSALYHSVRSGTAFSTKNYSGSIEKLKRALGCIRFGNRNAQGRIPSAPRRIEDTEYYAIELHTRNFGKVSINPEDYGDAHCVSWVLGSATDDDVVFCTARFAVDMTLYPGVADILPPFVLANHFLGCVTDSRVIRGGSERTSMVGMALASVLSIKLCMDPSRDDLLRLSNYIRNYTDCTPSSEPTFLPGVAILEVVLQDPVPVRDDSFQNWSILSNIPHDLPSSQKVCLSRTILQTVWRWRCNDPTTVFNFDSVDSFCSRLMANGDHRIPTLKINCFLVMTICLGAWADDIRRLFTPNTERALHTAIMTFHEQLRHSIRTKNAGPHVLTSILSTLLHLDPFRAPGTIKRGFEWIDNILSSDYPEDDRDRMATQAMQLLENHFCSKDPDSPLIWITSLLQYLSKYERLFVIHPPPCSRSIALRILSTSPESTHHITATLPLLNLALSQSHPLQLRYPALKALHRLIPAWFSAGGIPGTDFEGLLQAVDDPFQFSLDPSLLDGQPMDATKYDSMMVVIVLIEIASSDRWRNHLPGSNFASCESFISTENGRELAFNCLSHMETTWSEFLHTSLKVNAAVTYLEGIQCLNTAQAVKEWAQTTGIL